jgi:hypothetical protein
MRYFIFSRSDGENVNGYCLGKESYSPVHDYEGFGQNARNYVEEQTIS